MTPSWNRPTFRGLGAALLQATMEVEMHEAGYVETTSVEIGGKSPEELISSPGRIAQLAAWIEQMTGYGFSFAAESNDQDDFVVLSSSDERCNLVALDICGELLREISVQEILLPEYRRPGSAHYTISHGHLEISNVHSLPGSGASRCEDALFDSNGMFLILPEEDREALPEFD